MKHRLHVVSLPHTQVNPNFATCAYTDKVRKFCNTMHDLGDEVILYAGDKSAVACSEVVVCFTEAERLASLAGAHYTAGSFDSTAPHWVKFNSTVAAEVRKRARERDFLCLIAGDAHRPICDALPELRPLGPNPIVPAVEFGVGYAGTFTKFRVWESYAWMHFCYGHRATQPMAHQGDAFDAVIPGFLDPKQFPMGGKRSDYLLFVGRMVNLKGIHIAKQVAVAAGVRLVTAGPGEALPEVDHRGEVGPEMRAKLMGAARALIAPTLYVEPFGNVVTEAMACGTPVITTDWGAFTETVEQGVTGFRCRNLRQFVDGVALSATLDRHVIRKRALARFSAEVVGKQFHAYFDRLSTLWGGGWYELGS